MQKKLIAAAVAGALIAPAVATAASTSTVQIYGRITYEYGIGYQGDSGSGSQPNVDYADGPGGSAIGFKGEEKLGGGLSAWFQCESSADVRAIDQRGICTRNSAAGFKGSWGNLHFGRWDTPIKRALNIGTVGDEATGLQGMSFLEFGGSGGADATGTSGDSTNRQRWKRRETALSYYESPRFSGFQVLAAFSAGGIAAADNGVTSGTPNSKPRVISLAGIYRAGPLGIGLGYERHNDFGAYQAPAATTGLDDHAWGISASYTFARKVKVGATYLDAKYETSAATERKKKTWNIGVEWNIVGPHNLHLHYGRAGDTKGNDTTGIGGRLGSSRGGISASGSDTGGDQWQIGYRYNFSKRTWIKLAYSRVSNDARTNVYRIGNTASVRNGEDSSSLAFRIVHGF